MLDLSVVASCCSVQLDAVASAREATASGPRVMAVVLASVVSSVCVALAFVVARKPRRPLTVLTGALASLAVPLVIAAVVLDVAPYAFETPQHHCPFCLLRADVRRDRLPALRRDLHRSDLALRRGRVAPRSRARRRCDRRWSAFAASRLRRGAIAWVVCALVCAAPIVRFAIVSHGASLFSDDRHAVLVLALVSRVQTR